MLLQAEAWRASLLVLQQLQHTHIFVTEVTLVYGVPFYNDCVFTLHELVSTQ